MRDRLDMVGRLGHRAKKVGIETTEIAGLHAEWYRPPNPIPGKVFLFLHGGAYALGSCDSHRGLATHIAMAGNVETVLPEYRLAPENPFPAGLHDCVAVYRALLDKGYSADDIVIGGDSAGGGLTAATLLQLRHDGTPLPRAAVLLSPFLDMTASGESMTTRAKQDPWFDPENIAVVVGHYCPAEDLRNPLLSPVFANVAGLPPTLIQVGDDEILLSDSTRLADKMKAAGIDVQLEVFPGLWHVFQLFVGAMPESKAAVEKIGAFVQAAFGGEAAASA
ncbi:MAG: alpha/beta hydrolase [Planctomycetes bacterium]|nr:alpha/beta hydrolase [Planctomycetota bacterium]